jgi:uncharacterized protein YjbI with pentapeptide repeats
VEQYVEEESYKKKVPLIEIVMKWLISDDKRPMALLGQYGTGKSAFCQRFVSELARKNINEPGTYRIPVLLNLRQFTTAMDMKMIIRTFLDESCSVSNPQYKAFKQMNDAGLFVIVLDGLDEMKVRVDTEILETNMREIERLAIAPLSKVILTSRPEHFISVKEERRAFEPKGGVIETRAVKYKSIVLMPWDEKQINEFLNKRIPLVETAKETPEFYQRKIKDISDLSDLSKRPVLLEMIAKTLPQLVESGEQVDRPNLYEKYLKGEIVRQRNLKRRSLMLSDKNRFALLEKLALNNRSKKTLYVTYADAMDIINEDFGEKKELVEPYTREFLNCSFLVREKDSYRFSHKSFLEYLCARALSREIDSGEYTGMSIMKVESEVLDFMTEMILKVDPIVELLKNTAKIGSINGKYLGSNVITLLRGINTQVLKGKNLRRIRVENGCFDNMELIGTDFSGATFIDCDFVDSKLNSTNLQGTRMENCRFNSADFTEANLKQSVFVECKLCNTHLSKATLDGCRIDRCDLDNANLVKADLSGIILEESNLSRVSFAETEMDGAILQNCKMIGVQSRGKKFQNVIIVNSSFSYSDLTGSDFSGVKLHGTYFIGSDLSKVTFNEADLSKANFRHANLFKATFLGAKLYGTDFTGAKVDDAVFTGGSLKVARFRVHSSRFKIKKNR